MSIFFSAGEPSGDLHAANLLTALRNRDPDVRGVGYGGPRFVAAGGELHHDMMSLAVVGFGPILWNIRRFWKLLRRAEDYFRDQRPSAVVLVDYPGFNWLIAKRAKKYGIPVFYFSPPQIWGWARWRTKKMRRLVDHVFCGLPFEEEWLRRHGCNATYTGHPYFDELAHRSLDADFVAQLSGRRLITLLPGSRDSEVRRNVPLLIHAACIVANSVRDVRFAFACYKASQAEAVRAAVHDSGLPIAVHQGRTPELIRAAHSCLSVSGSVSLELLHAAKPSVIVYRVPRFLYWLQFLFRRVKYITLVNLLNSPNPLDPPDLKLYDPHGPDADQVLFPEYVTPRDNAEQLASHFITWLTNDAEHARVTKELVRLRESVAHPGASARAAECILAELAAKRSNSDATRPAHRAAG
jgi:lipid-A-disaccharide synthase